MSSAASLKTRCPVCSKKYEVPVSAAGHKARCTDCQTVFRVPSPPVSRLDESMPPASVTTVSSVQNREPSNGRHAGPPTEEDIVRWLSEGAETEMDDTTPQPRVVRQSVPVSQRPGAPVNGSGAGTSATAAHGAGSAEASKDGSGTPIPLSSANGRTSRSSTPGASDGSLRKTG